MSCTSTSDCASGYACVGGNCIRAASAAATPCTGTGNTDGNGGGTTCGGAGGDQCSKPGCGTPVPIGGCCGGPQYWDEETGQIVCGVEPITQCDVVCTEHYKATGEHLPGCGGASEPSQTSLVCTNRCSTCVENEDYDPDSSLIDERWAYVCKPYEQSESASIPCFCPGGECETEDCDKCDTEEGFCEQDCDTCFEECTYEFECECLSPSRQAIKHRRPKCQNNALTCLQEAALKAPPCDCGCVGPKKDVLVGIEPELIGAVLEIGKAGSEIFDQLTGGTFENLATAVLQESEDAQNPTTGTQLRVRLYVPFGGCQDVIQTVNGEQVFVNSCTGNVVVENDEKGRDYNKGDLVGITYSTLWDAGALSLPEEQEQIAELQNQPAITFEVTEVADGTQLLEAGRPEGCPATEEGLGASCISCEQSGFYEEQATGTLYAHWLVSETAKAMTEGVLVNLEMIGSPPREIVNATNPSLLEPLQATLSAEFPLYSSENEDKGGRVILGFEGDKDPEGNYYLDENDNIIATHFTVFLTATGKDYYVGEKLQAGYDPETEENYYDSRINFVVTEVFTPQQKACCGECNCHADCAGKLLPDGKVADTCSAELRCIKYGSCSSQDYCFEKTVNFTDSCPAGTTEIGRIETETDICLTCEKCEIPEDEG